MLKVNLSGHQSIDKFGVIQAFLSMALAWISRNVTFKLQAVIGNRSQFSFRGSSATAYCQYYYVHVYKTLHNFSYLD